MYNYTINNKTYGPYEAICYPNGEIKGDINPIIYDNAIIELNGTNVNYIFCYKTSKNIFGKIIKYVDIINNKTGEIFSFQTSNIFFARVISDDLKVIAKIGKELKYFENFGKSQLNIESDGDKNEIVPLGYYDMFIAYDEDFYYPIIINENIQSQNIKRFYDYYGYKSYIDSKGQKHLIMLIQDENEDWFWVDNFIKISEKIKFSDDIEEIEDWDISDDLIINMKTNYNKFYYVNNSGKITEGKIDNKEKKFIYTRYFEDTDTDFIVGKNDKGFFVIDRFLEKIDNNKKNKLLYYKNFLFHLHYNNSSYFLMTKYDGTIILIDSNSNEVIITDLSENDIVIKGDYNSKILNIELSNGEVRKFLSK